MRFLRGRSDPEQVNLNLTPMIDLFVSLIAFLLLTAAFIRYGGVNVDVPQAASKHDQLPKTDKLNLTFEVVGNDVEVTGYNSDFTGLNRNVKRKFSTADLDPMKTYLQTIHQEYPNIGISIFHASPETRYEVAMAVLDAMKTSTVIDNIVFGAGVVQ